MDLAEHIRRQMAFSRATFGPGERREGVTDHIKKELIEIVDSEFPPYEWVDVVILALDGFWRSVAAEYATPWHSIPEYMVRHIAMKQAENEQRSWPDWRTAEPDKAIEHVREEVCPTCGGYCGQCGGPR